MIVNAFALCDSAEFTDIGTLNVTHAGIGTVIIPNPGDGEFAFRLNGFLIAARQPGDPEQPILTIRLRDGQGYDQVQQVMISGWTAGACDTPVALSHFPVDFKAPHLGDYLVTAHTETSGDLAVALLPLGLRAT